MQPPDDEGDMWVAEIIVAAVIAVSLGLIYAGYQAADIAALRERKVI